MTANEFAKQKNISVSHARTQLEGMVARGEARKAVLRRGVKAYAESTWGARRIVAEYTLLS